MKKTITLFLVLCILCCCAMSTSAYNYSVFPCPEENCSISDFNFKTDQKMSETAENILLSDLEKNSLIFNYIDKESFEQQDHIARTASTYAETNLYKTALVNYQNCYGYAIQVYSDEAYCQLISTVSGGYIIGDGEHYLQQPGEFSTTDEYDFDDLISEYIYYDSYGSANQYIDFIDAKIKDDFTKLYVTEGYEWQILDSTANATVPDGYRKICLVVGNGTEKDYHFYLRHNDGTWSHKPGSTERIYVSLSTNEQITDANIASVANQGFYSGGLQRYYLIKKSAVNEYYHSNPLNGASTFYSYAPGGNTIEKSMEINAGTTQLKLDYARDVDYFAFTPQTSGYYGINTFGTLDINGLSNSDLNVNMGVYDEIGIIICTGSYAFGEASVGCNMTGNKTYYIRFWSQANEMCTSNMLLRLLY